MHKLGKVVAKEDGAILVFTVLIMVVLLGMAALAIDIGQMYIAKQRAQNVCDAAALAGGQLLTGKPDCIPGAEATAIEYKDANNAEVAPWQVEDKEDEDFADASITTVNYDDGTPAICKKGEAIRVTGRVHVNFAFAGIFGMSEMYVPADATVLLTPAQRLALNEVIPIGFSPDAVEGLDFGDEPEFGNVEDWQDGFIGPGNWLSLRFGDDSGVTDYIDQLVGEGEPAAVFVGDTVTTETGDMGLKTYEGLVGKFNSANPPRFLRDGEGRLNLETNPLYAPTDIYTGYNPTAWDTWQASKDPETGLYDGTNRIVILPVVEGTSTGTSTELVVVGFAAFFIVRVFDGTDEVHPKGEIEGHFIQAIIGEEGDDASWVFPVEGTPIDDPRGVRQLRLIS